MSEQSLNRYLYEISQYPLIENKTDEQNVVRRAREGDSNAFERLVTANLRFVVFVAKQFQGRGVPLADLISDGNIGLVLAARRFDERKGFKFISYAVWWVRQRMIKLIADQAGAVRRPPGHVARKSQTSKAMIGLAQELGRLPTDADIAEAIGLPVADIHSAQGDFAQDISLDEVRGGEADTRWVDLIKDESPSPAKQALVKALRLEIDWALSTLDEREAEVVSMLFGLNGDPPSTYQEIGERFGFSRERARQIQKKAMTKLRYRTRSRRLQAFIGALDSI